MVRHLNPAIHHSARITKADFKDIKFWVKIWDIHKIEKKNSISISVIGYENKRKTSNLRIKKCLQAFIIEEILKRHIKNSFDINGKQRIMMPKKDEYDKFKACEIKIKLLSLVYPDFESILLPEDNEWKAKPKWVLYQQISKTSACSYRYKLVCVIEKFSKSSKSHLGEDAVYFISSMIIESKCCKFWYD